MKIEDLYAKITSSEELKKGAIEALKTGKIDEFFKENNIDLTKEQLKEYLQNLKSGLLSREELNTAAGGGCGDNCADWEWSIGTFGVGCIVSAAEKGTALCSD